MQHTHWDENATAAHKKQSGRALPAQRWKRVHAGLTKVRERQHMFSH
jgi:hypothetical protein